MRRYWRGAEALPARWSRAIAGLLITGIVVEIALTPIALFLPQGGALWRTCQCPAAIRSRRHHAVRALALLFDGIGLGTPFWWVTEQALRLLIALAHQVADTPGSVTTLPRFPPWAFGLTLAGGLWILVWQRRWRWWGAAPMAVGMAVLIAQPQPDLLITSDGRHIAAAVADGDALLTAQAVIAATTMPEISKGGSDAPLAALARA